MAATNDTDALAELTRGEAEAVSRLVSDLDDDPSELDVYEGAMTGMFYIGVETNAYLRAEVTPNGLETMQIPGPELDEELDSVAHIEPDENETVEDAVDNLAFTGGD